MHEGQINPRSWFNWHPREFKPWYYDRHRWEYEQMQWQHVHHLLCQQVFLKDMLQLARYPEPDTVIIDVRMNTEKMHHWIPNSNWIPRDEIEYALQLSETEFKELYGFHPPRQGDNIILVSHNGYASEQAGWEFKKQYFPSVFNYRAGTNELFGESYLDFPLRGKLSPWKGPFPQSGIYIDVWSKRKVLTRTGPFDRQYEMQDFSLPDLEAEKARHPAEGPRMNMPWGLR